MTHPPDLAPWDCDNPLFDDWQVWKDYHQHLLKRDPRAHVQVESGASTIAVVRFHLKSYLCRLERDPIGYRTVTCHGEQLELEL